MGLLKQAQIDAMLQHGGETPHRLLLGEALVLKGFVTPETLDKELKEYHKESEREGAEISLAFSNLAHKNIVKTFTDLILMMFTQFGKQNIIIERCETGKEESPVVSLGDRAKDRRRKRPIQLCAFRTA